MIVVLDSGAFVAVDKGDRRVGAMLRVIQQRRIPIATSSAVVAQVWRDGRKQARVAQVLAGVQARALAPDADRRTGELLAAAKTSDIADAHLALGVEPGDRVVTSDPEDIDHLLSVRRVDATIVEV